MTKSENRSNLRFGWFFYGWNPLPKIPPRPSRFWSQTTHGLARADFLILGQKSFFLKNHTFCCHFLISSRILTFYIAYDSLRLYLSGKKKVIKNVDFEMIHYQKCQKHVLANLGPSGQPIFKKSVSFDIYRWRATL